MSEWRKGQTYPKKKYYIENGLLWTRFKKPLTSSKNSFWNCFLLTNVSQKFLKSNWSNNGKAMLSCPYQGIFKQSTKFTENVLEKLSKVFFRKMHAKLFEGSKNYLFQCLTYHRQCNGQQKWFCKSYTSKIHSRENFRIHLHRWIIHIRNLLKTSE